MDNVTKLLMQGAAGAGSKTTYVDDVFSTYLYKGTDANQTIDNGLKLGNSNTGNGVKFSGSSGQLEVASTSDFAFGTGPFTIEFWLYFQSVTDYCAMFEGRPNSGNGAYLTFGFASGYLSSYSDSAYRTQGSTGTTAPAVGQWTHIALVREGTGTNEEKIYFNGTQVAQGTNPINIGNQRCMIAGHAWSRGNFNGHISNYRVTKGQALYTSNFTPSTQALTTTSQGAIASNVKLLCCNKNIVTGSTVTPGTITATGNPVSQGFGPFTATDGEGGLVWLKERTGTNWNQLYDTARGVGYALSSNSTNASSFEADKLTAFNNTGFSIGVNDIQNDTGDDYASWSFRKSKGFFDIVTYTGNGTTGQNISHNLGSVPGMIMVKRTDATSNWWVYNRGIGATKSLFLQSPTSASTDSRYWNDTAPTASQFTVGEYPNTSGGSYIAYVFAGGESNASEARSVDFDGSDVAYTDNSSNYTLGTGDFTLEYWFKADVIPSSGNYSNLVDYSDNDWGTRIQPDGTHQYMSGAAQITSSTKLGAGQWNHIAIVRNSGYAIMYVNGVQEGGNYNNAENYTFTQFYMGRRENGTNTFDGKISNLRLVVGTAVYTSSFRPPTEPLTNITNTKLLCFNSSSVTGTTVGTIEVSGNAGLLPTASTDSPFDDPEGFKFGEEGDQNLIKCGSFTTDSNEDANIYLGWEPQYLLIKRTDGGSHGWNIVDSMRGFPNAQDVQANQYGGCQVLEPNFDVAEISTTRYGLTPTGFYADQFGANRSYVYIAIRRPDGYVAKPAEAGTDVFAMDTGASSSTIPNFDSGFPVGFAFMKTPASSGDWYTGARLLSERYVRTNSSDAGADWGGGFDWDSNVGWLKSSASSAWQSWMWKRGAGFDVATYSGNGTGGTQISHSLGRTPEMIWVKNRSTSGNTGDWMVGHKDLYGGSSPWNGYLVLNKSQQQYNDQKPFYNVAPTSINFTLDGWDRVNANGSKYIAMLFASVEGISKVGSYSGSSYDVTVNLGFTPRFLMVKAYNTSSGNQRWTVFDSLRGMGAGSNDNRMYLDDNQAQQTGDYITSVSATGITMKTNFSYTNSNGYQYIYYAHA